MKTNILMTASAIVLALAGVLLTFMPTETLRFVRPDIPDPSLLVWQVLGALCFSYAMLNWMTRAGKFGGIYNRPIVVANLTHFTIAALALDKGLLADPSASGMQWVIAGAYTILAIAFGAMLFHDPLRGRKPD
jgi:hypothetical protein